MTVWSEKAAGLFVKNAFEAAGLSAEKAGVVADSLIFAALRGVDSHGLSRCGIYLKRIESGLVDKDAEIEVVSSSPSGALIDAHNTVGQHAALKAAELAASMAGANGIAMVGVTRSNHFGAAGFYVNRIAEEGLIGITGSNSAKAMLLWGSSVPFLGTNPLAYAVPAGKYPPLILDMATSVVARGRIRRALKQRESVPPDWAIGLDGRRTTDAAEAYRGHVLPFGGAKGSAIALLIEILSGVVTGSAIGPEVGSMYSDFNKPQGLGHFFIAISPEHFIGKGAYNSRMESLVESIKALPASEGNAEVLLPGEIERRIEENRKFEGIPIPPDVMETLREVSEKYSVPLPGNP